jgi:hypothetical protein
MWMTDVITMCLGSGDHYSQPKSEFGHLSHLSGVLVVLKKRSSELDEVFARYYVNPKIVRDLFWLACAQARRVRETR